MEYREFVCAAIETMNQKEGKKRDTGKRTQSSKKQREDSCWIVASGNGIQSVSDNLSGGIL